MLAVKNQRVETRLYVEEGLTPGRTIGLDHARAHYLRSVLRLARGARVALFNGRDGEWLAEIEALGKGWCSLSVVANRRQQQSEPDLWLAFAPIKRARIDFLVEKATELGCTALLPVMTRHTAVSRVNTERLAASAREASEQCERLSVPALQTPRDLASMLGEWPSDRRLLACAEAGATRPLAQVLQDALARDPAAGNQPWAVLTGPEGGFARSELDALAKLPFVTAVGLGRLVLRADTAALVALACWQALLGDGRERPSFRDAGLPPSCK